MSYSYDKFLRPITTTDKNIQIIDNTGIVKYTINPFSVINVMISNNLLKINMKQGRVILINFSSSNESKLAISRIQEQLDTLREKTPLLIDKQIESYFSGIDTHLIPSTDSVYDLGTASKQWRSLYLSGSTIYLGGVTISTAGDSLVVNSINFGTVEEPFILSSGTSSLLVNGTSSSIGTSGTSGTSGISGGSYNYSNGITLNGLTVSLGGTLSETILLSGGLNDLLFTGFDNLVFTSSVFDVVSDIISLDSNDSTQILSVNDVTINAGGQISLSGNSGLVSIGNTQGLVYQSDYKLGFVTHSLVDKGYVDFAIEGVSKYRGTSSTQIVVPEPGYVVTFTTQTNLAYTPGETVIMYDTYPNLYMIDDYVEDSISGNIIGTVDLYDTLTGSMSVVVDYSESIGNTYSYWYINLSGKSGITTDNLSITNLNVSGTSSLTGHTILQYVSEVINPPIGATDSMVIYDFTGGNIWYHGTASTDYTANFINLPTDDNKVTTATIILPQDSIAYVPTIVQIDGTTQIVKWGGATAGNSNKVDIIGFTFIRTNSSWSQVLGNINSFS